MKRTIFAALIASICLMNAGADVVPGPIIPDISKTPFVRGDCNNDGALNHADAVMVYTYLFNPSDLEVFARVALCPDAADANDDGQVDLADGSYIMMYLYAQGPLPPTPFPGVGQDLTEDDLYCYPRPRG